MEYKVGQEWGSTKAPVATRFICSYDASNSEMTMLETFFNNLDAFKPDLILLSGLHMLESLEPEFFESRLAALIQGLDKVDARIPVHLEFASMMDKNFMRSILEKAMSKVTSLGLNEQELAFASIAMNGPHSDHLEMSEGQPVIHIMSDLIHWMLSTYGKSSKRPDSRLTRIHFHSLTYHIVSVHKDHWKNVKSATMAGTRVAGHQACDTKESNPHFVDLRIPLEFKLYSGDVQRKFDPHNPAFTWTMGEFYFVFSPVLVCKHPLKTVGLGDAISATGLMFSEFSP
ncbi:hypothetical protein V1264_002092 [Littorina saxatilis]|uniref:ADP-dependent glucokinase n=2 Tax=Littorina saxatilis TaxID=31220 RepID=A0AAN9C2V0_9CAEN